jgi:hypothetical protein
MSRAAFAVCPHGVRIAGHRINPERLDADQASVAWAMEGAPLGSHSEIVEAETLPPIQMCGPCIQKRGDRP